MTRLLGIAFLAATLSLPVAGVADTLVARHTVRSKFLISEADLEVVPDDVPGALTHPLDAVGMEARVVLYAGRPIRAADIGPPAVIERNQIVTLVFNQGGLAISTDGRSLARAGVGDTVRVMNLASKSTVSGLVDDAGRVIVGSPERTPQAPEGN